jgi:hypothetical protein
MSTTANAEAAERMRAAIRHGQRIAERVSRAHERDQRITRYALTNLGRAVLEQTR